MKYISRLQYITQRETLSEIEQEVKDFLTGGGDWVQLRMKNATEKEFLEVALRVKELCYSYNATFIINDNVHVALQSGADGIHLGKGDTPTSEVRRVMGSKIIVGRTASGVRDIEILSGQNVDYIGLGPYKWTDTKKNIGEILGKEGYENILDELYKKEVDFPPVIAIGSVSCNDIEVLLEIDGIHGVAVSGSIANCENSRQATMDFVKKIDIYNENYNIK